ncbi:thioredoxin domain-containing protein 15 [Phyllobates terribilis]|uniref:thioredoxin domain-containing protein 15 n=1 Tax=Phyllobates terribilis TaxID=111132 RepID=UPI003CCB203E
MGLPVRVVIICGVYFLWLALGARGNQGEDVYQEDHPSEILQNSSPIPTTVGYEGYEESRSTGAVQYKTAEIADAMQSLDIQTDPAVLLSMLPRVMKDRAGANTVCDTETGGEECGSSDDSLSNSDDQSQEQTQNMDASAADTDSNTTDSSKPLKVNCEDRNITNMENFTLQILNISQDLMDFLNPNSSECSMVLFFTPWCQFSADLAPHFNALPRAFPTLQFLALDASQHSSLSTRFGTVAVPNILLFQGAKPMARFNHSERNLESFKSFIFNQSGIEAIPDIFVTEADIEGPLPSTPQAGIDWLLVFSVVYVTSFIVYATMQTDRIRWLIPGQEHEHQE